MADLEEGAAREGVELGCVARIVQRVGVHGGRLFGDCGRHLGANLAEELDQRIDVFGAPFLPAGQRETGARLVLVQPFHDDVEHGASSVARKKYAGSPPASIISLVNPADAISLTKS